MAALIKSLDPNHLVVDGGVNPTEMNKLGAHGDDWPVDIVGGTYYGADSLGNLKKDIATAWGSLRRSTLPPT